MPNLLTLPIPSYQIISSKSRCCVLPYVSSHPRPPRATIQGQVTVAPFPRDLKIGHDPSLGAPMPGITAPRRGRTVGQNPVRFVLLSPGRKHPNCSPLHCHLALCRLFTHLCCTASADQTMSLFASYPEAPVQLCTVLRQRVATMTFRAHRTPMPQVTEHLISCQRMSNSIATCDLNCNDTC